MALDKTAIDDVAASIDESIEAMGYALSRIKDCGLDNSEQRMIEEHLRKGIRLLDMAYDFVDFAED